MNIGYSGVKTTLDDITREVEVCENRVKRRECGYVQANAFVKNIWCDYAIQMPGVGITQKSKAGEIYLTVIWAIQETYGNKLIDPVKNLSYYGFSDKTKRRALYEKIKRKYNLSTPDIYGFGSKSISDFCVYLLKHYIDKKGTKLLSLNRVKSTLVS